MTVWTHVQTPRGIHRPDSQALIHPWRPRYLWDRYGADISWLSVYLLGNALVFWLRFRQYPRDSCVGYGPAIAKGSAEVVMLNCVLALMSVCHRGLDRLRLWASSRGDPSSFMQRPIEMHRQFHTLTGSITVAMSLVHSVTWCFIVHWARSCDEAEWNKSSLARRHVKIVRVEPSVGWLLLKLPMWTGIAMMLGVILLVPFCAPVVRLKFFQIFEAVHMIVLIPFVTLLMIHGANEWSSHLQAPLWLVPALVVYAVERRRRLSSGSASSIVCFSVTTVDSTDSTEPYTTIRVFLTKTKRSLRRFEPGMFIYLQIPGVSFLEWHSFSVCSCQDDALVELRIRVVGDWTTKLLTFLSTSARHDGTLMPAAVPVRIDGPFGTPTAQFSRYDRVALLAMGIGVSPFLSVVRHQLHAWRHQLTLDPSTTTFSPRMTLVWVIRDTAHIEWLAETLSEFDDIIARVTPGSLAIQVFVTGPAETPPIAYPPEIVLHTKRRRPDWAQVLVAWASSSVGASRAAFVSGSRHATSAVKRAAAASRGVDVYAESFR